MSLGHGASVVRDGLVLHLDAANVKSYPGTGTTWSDLSGNGNNGTLTNDPTFVSSGVKHISFDGSNDRAWVKNLNYGGGNTLPEMSVFAWVRTTFNSGTPGVWDNNNWSILDFDRSEVFTFTLNGTGEIQMSGDSSNFGGFADFYDLVGNNSYNDGNWHYVGWTFSVSNQEIIMYGDGGIDRVFTGNGSMTALGAGVVRYGLIGDGSEASSENGTGNNIYFEGDIGALQFYETKALTGAEIKQNFEATRSRYGI